MVRKIYAPKKVKAGPSLIIEISLELVTGFCLNSSITTDGKIFENSMSSISNEVIKKALITRFICFTFFYELKSIHFWRANVGDH